MKLALQFLLLPLLQVLSTNRQYQMVQESVPQSYFEATWPAQPGYSLLMCAALMTSLSKNSSSFQMYTMDSGVCRIGRLNFLLEGKSGDNMINVTMVAQLEYNNMFLVGGINAANQVETVNLLARSSQANRRTLANFTGSSWGAVGTFIEGKVLVCGGYIWTQHCYNYNPGNDTWLDAGYQTSVGRDAPAAIQLSQTQWWVTGGYTPGGDTVSTEMLTIGEGFAPYIDLPLPLALHNLVRINFTCVVLVGGDVTSSNSTWIFNFNEETWTRLPDLIVPTYQTQAGLVTHSNGTSEVVVASGAAGTLATQIFDLATQTWRLGQDFPTYLQLGGSVQYGDTFLVVGGETGDESNSIFMYKVDVGGWGRLGQSLPQARIETAAFLVPDLNIDVAGT